LVDTAADIAFIAFDLLTLAFGPEKEREATSKRSALTSQEPRSPAPRGSVLSDELDRPPLEWPILHCTLACLVNWTSQALFAS
jgi:hypothetical protein